MIKGDKIKLVKPMGAFKNVGEICEVVDVAEGGVISFKFGNGMHLGCMSYDEYEKYFEKVELPEKREWSNWKSTDISFCNLDGDTEEIIIQCRDNGKKVQVKFDDLRSESTCCNTDVFVFMKGFELATKRLIVKYLSNQVKTLARKM